MSFALQTSEDSTVKLYRLTDYSEMILGKCSQSYSKGVFKKWNLTVSDQRNFGSKFQAGMNYAGIRFILSHNISRTSYRHEISCRHKLCVVYM